MAYSRVSGVDHLPNSTGVSSPATEHTSRADYSQHTAGADYSQHTKGADYSKLTAGADYSHLEESVYHSSNEDFLNDSHQSITTHQTGYTEEDEDRMSEYHGMCEGRATVFITLVCV